MACLRSCVRHLSILPCLARHSPVLTLHTSSHNLIPSIPKLIPTNRIHYARHATSSRENKAEKEECGPSYKAKANGRRLQVITGACTALFGALFVLKQQLSAKEVADEGSEKGSVEDKTSEAVEEEEGKKRISFHDRRVIEYENRIRAYSTPDKIFRYFATVRLKCKGEESQIYMTPDDFLRSITPEDIQPTEYGLDKFRTMSMELWEKERHTTTAVCQNSVFSSLGYHGLISFSDYLFLLTILATPARHFEIAFKMFDLNGDGEVDSSEFQTVQDVILNSTAMGTRHRDHSTTGSVAGSMGDGLVEKFFGPKRDQRLTVGEFKTFHTELLEAIMKMEFDRFDKVNGKIGELDFSHLILSYASMNNQRKKKYFKRVKKKYGRELSSCPDEKGGISFEDVKIFSQLVECISDVEMALSMQSAAGVGISAADLKSVAKAVVGVEFSDHLVEFIITLFDEDGDGDLSHKEFIKVIKSRTSRGLEKSKELGFSKLMGAIAACSLKTVKDQLGLLSR